MLTANHWRTTNPIGCDHENMIRVAEEALSKRLPGEDPVNDMTARQKKLVVALNVLRQDIEETLASYESGRMSSRSAIELIHDYKTAIDAIVRCE